MRVIRINGCVDCPYYNEMECYCSMMERKVESENGDEPEWCPLPVR
jgi:hypothetical protein